MTLSQTISPLDAPAIRWGILGPGGIAHRFAREVQAYTRSQIVAVGSRDLGRAQGFAAEACPQARAYGSYEALVADGEVDAVYIASPHSEHHDHALLALAAGKPVLVEKSFTLNAAQAREVFNLAGAKGLFAMEAMWSRFLPHYSVMRELVRAGDLGEVRSILGLHAQSLNMDPAWRMMNPALGGGALLDLGIYPISLIHWLWGVPDQVEATGVLTDTGVDLRENISLWYGEHLATAYVDMSVSARNNLQVLGTGGRVEIDDWFYNPQDLVVTLADGKERILETKVEGGFQYEAAEAARCIAAGMQQSPLMPWTATVEILAVMDEVRRQIGVVYPQERD